MQLENEGATPEVQQNEVIEQPKSMDDTIRDVLRAQQERNQEPAEAPEVAPSAAAPAEPAEAAKRIHDTQGKFAATAPAAEAPSATKETEPAPVEATASTAPNTWKK